MKKNKELKTIIELLLFLIITAAVTIIAFPHIKRLGNVAERQKFIEWILSRGIGGWFVIFGLQILQIIAAFIPGGPVEVIAGLLYGGLGGLLTCISGSIIASFIIFTLSKKLGTPLIEKFFKKDERERFSFLNDSRKLEMIIFILFLIPGIPKDMLTYIAGTTSIKTSRFLLLSSIARIPAVALSTYIGSTVRLGEWHRAIIIFAVVILTGIFGIFYKDRIIDFSRKIGRRRHPLEKDKSEKTKNKDKVK